MNPFTVWLKKYMKLNKISQYKLQKLGVPQSTLSNILNEGKSPTFKTMQKICSALDVPVSQFDSPSLSKVMSIADNMNLDPVRKEALGKIKALPIDEQQARLDDAITNYKNLSPEAREALAKIIKMLSANQQ